MRDEPEPTIPTTNDQELEQEIDTELAQQAAEHEYKINQMAGSVLFYLAVIALMVGMIVWQGIGAGLVMDSIVMFILAAIHLSKDRKQNK